VSGRGTRYRDNHNVASLVPTWLIDRTNHLGASPNTNTLKLPRTDFPPGPKVARWIEQGKMSPNPVDQPGILAINGDEAALRIRMMSGDSEGGGWATTPPAPKVEGAVVP